MRNWLITISITAGIVAISAFLGIVIIKLQTTLDPSLPQSKRVGETPRSFINRWHDPEMNVTCWQFSQGVYCLPDQFINQNQQPSYAE